ncbi:hypothetical protein IV500_01110 [Paeniglutamicibacter antarcticus]|uniref:Uncharacterized protein n=1 Tax=Arthrobacter terrae TaxID=2935737 RepID=A0A931CLG6_9MICC|nr:DUF6544 family protein [Arthrobacter terrae]MBG0738036.1 hypothetical protein [Arthrobacter terrae]
MSFSRRRPQSIAEWEQRLTQKTSPLGCFNSGELSGLPEPVRRHFTAAIRPGTPLVRAVRLQMQGRIKLGRWLPFRATQLLDPHKGFIWAARVARIITGSDRYLDDVGGMDWKLAGLFNIAHGSGSDVSRSAAGRGGAEAIWVPAALLPRFGATWSATSDSHVCVHHLLGNTPVEVDYTIGPDGRIRSLVFDRWGDPDSTGIFQWHPFGGEITGYRTFGGLTIPSAGRLGWGFGTDRWPDSEFFRYQITELQPIA